MQHSFWPCSPFSPFMPSFPGPPGCPGSPSWERRKQTRVEIPTSLDMGLNQWWRLESPGSGPRLDTHALPIEGQVESGRCERAARVPSSVKEVNYEVSGAGFPSSQLLEGRTRRAQMITIAFSRVRRAQDVTGLWRRCVVFSLLLLSITLADSSVEVLLAYYENTDDCGYTTWFGMERNVLEGSPYSLRVVVNITDQVGMADPTGNVRWVGFCRPHMSPAAQNTLPWAPTSCWKSAGPKWLQPWQ